MRGPGPGGPALGRAFGLILLWALRALSYPFSKGIFLSRFRIRFNMHAFNDTITAESISTGTDCSIEEMIP